MNSTLEATTDRQNRARSRSTAGGLRIVHVVSSLQIGGMEHFTLRIAHQQRQRGHDASVLALQGGPLLAEAERIGLPVHCLRGGKPLRVAQALLHLARRRPAIVHPHNPSSLHYAVLGKLSAGARVVMTYHGRGAQDARLPSAREWAKTDAVVAVSAAAVDQIDADRFRDRLTVIRNGVVPTPPARTRQAVRDELGAGDRIVGIIVARVDGRKGHETLIQALGLLCASRTPVLLLVAGDGAERARLERLAASQGLGPEWVRFLGFRSDVPDLLGASDFFALPSVTEGLPLSMLEAMTHGLPVVATPVGGIPEVVRNGEHGLLVPVGDASRLADAIQRLATDAGLRRRMGEAARERACSEFSFETMTDQYLELYARLVAGRKDVLPG
jgi:glycosyltransferase involved in cell wall biosynthesis